MLSFLTTTLGCSGSQSLFSLPCTVVNVTSTEQPAASPHEQEHGTAIYASCQRCLIILVAMHRQHVMQRAK